MCQRCTNEAARAYVTGLTYSRTLLNRERDTLLQEICDQLDPFGMEGNVPAVLGLAASLIATGSGFKVEPTRRPSWLRRVFMRMKTRRVEPAPMLQVYRIK